MFSNNPNPCTPTSSSTDNNNNFSNYGPANCFRPLQQLYKTVYRPICGNDALRMNIECICRPAERYKTTNMTYGSFYYDKSLSSSSTEKNHAINYDKAAFARCYDYNNLSKSGYQSSDDNRGNNSPIFGGPMDPQESQFWTQTTNDACCPTDCCSDRNYIIPEHCKNNYQNLAGSNPSSSSNIVPSYTSQLAQPTTKSSNVQVRCV